MQPLSARDDWTGASVSDKIDHSKDLLNTALDYYGTDGIGVAITGGKDSTLALWLLRSVCLEKDLPLPGCMFIDEGDGFEEIFSFVEGLEKAWKLSIFRMRNAEIIEKARFVGDMISVADLGPANRRELERIGFEEDRFPFEPESFVGNHLMKTVPMKQFIGDRGIRALITAIRWDEQTARTQEEFISPRNDPPHTRIHPILHFRERDVWAAIHRFDIPFCTLYREGYRSLGAKSTTRRAGDLAAWEQDLEHTPERAGRGQDKEHIMAQLRDLGYM